MIYRTTCFFWTRAGNGRPGRECTYKDKEFEAANDDEATEKHKVVIEELIEEAKSDYRDYYQEVNGTWLHRIDVPKQYEKTTFLGS